MLRLVSSLTEERFLGRSSELGTTRDLLARTRLVTVTGPGGIGKTSLARHIVADIADRSVHWAELAEIRRDGHIDDAVAVAFGISSIDDFADQSSGPRLLVLDNCEHVLDRAADLVRRLLSDDDELQVLATSRRPLELGDEYTVRLAGHDESEALFLACARRAQATALPGDADPAVSALCARLDGIPLAIELAAARTRSMSPGEIVALLHEDHGAIDDRGRDRPGRHRRLIDTIAWSDRLLDDRVRKVFHRLSAFTTEFSAHDAHAVCEDLTESRLDTSDVLDELVAHSLLDRPGRDQPRFRLLETIKGYGRARLAESGELADSEQRVVDRCVAVADDIYARGKHRWSLESILDAVVAYPAVLNALDHCIEHDADPGRAARLMRVLFPLSLEAQAGAIVRLAEALVDRWSSELADGGAVSHPEVGEALAVAGLAAFTLQRYEQAEQMARMTLGENPDDSHVGHMAAHWILGRLSRERSDAQDAHQHFVAARTAAERDGSQAGALQSDVHIAQATALAGDRDRALNMLQEIRATALADDMLINALHAASTEGYLRLPHDPEGARQSAQAAITLAQQLGGPQIVGVNHRTIGIAALCENDLTTAATELQAAVAYYLGGATNDELSSTLRWVAEYCDASGRPEAATTIRATADVYGQRIPMVCPPERPAARTAAIDRRTALDLAYDVLSAPVPAAQISATSGVRQGQWLRRGEHWDVGIDGNVVTMRHSKGMADIDQLLRNPGVDISVADLADVVIERDVGPALDSDARRAIEARIRECQDDLDDAEARNDLGRSQLASEELDLLIDELSSAHGLLGRARPQGDSVERARSAVTARIRSTIKRLFDLDIGLARHLDNCISTGRMCTYTPDRPVEWRR